MSLRQVIESILHVLFQLFVIFPYSALTIRRNLRVERSPTQAESSRLLSPTPSTATAEQRRNKMISDRVYKLCTSPDSVSSLLAQDPTLTPGEAWKKLYGRHAENGGKGSKSEAKEHRDEITPEDLKRAAECGKWGPTQPSELFLRMYHDALCTLDYSISGAAVSPSLMGSCGTIPLTVISTYSCSLPIL
jgi:hypothetical protein